MENIWNEEHRIKSYEVDFNKRIKLISLFNYMQEAAYNHACHLGAGYEALNETGLLWVLSRVKIKLYKYPVWNDEVRIETWPKGKNRLFALRDFLFYDSRNNQIGAAITAWLLLSSKNMRPQKIESLPVQLPLNEGKHGLDEIPDKLDFDGSYNKTRLLTASYSDVDVNHHVNNGKYVEWILDSFPEEFHSRNQIASLQINFLSETKLGDEVALDLALNDSCNCCCEGRNAQTSSKLFQAYVEWI